MSGQNVKLILITKSAFGIYSMFYYIKVDPHKSSLRQGGIIIVTFILQRKTLTHEYWVTFPKLCRLNIAEAEWEPGNLTLYPILSQWCWAVIFPTQLMKYFPTKSLLYLYIWTKAWGVILCPRNKSSHCKEILFMLFFSELNLRKTRGLG